jgi:hypothetical protein
MKQNKGTDTLKLWDRKRKIFVVLLLIILIAIAVFICFKSCSGQWGLKEPETTPVYLEDEGGSPEGEAEQTDRDALLAELEKQQLVVTDKLSSNITFESGEAGTIGEWVVENPADNTVIMQAEVYLDDVLIAKSTPIYPDQHITGIELLKEVESGDYEVTAYLDYYDLETKEFISKAGYKIHLTVN